MDGQKKYVKLFHETPTKCPDSRHIPHNSVMTERKFSLIITINSPKPENTVTWIS